MIEITYHKTTIKTLERFLKEFPKREYVYNNGKIESMILNFGDGPCYYDENADEMILLKEEDLEFVYTMNSEH